MPISAKKKMALFFTFGTSLKDWENAGILSREVLPYQKLVADGHQVTFFTYGDKEDLEVLGQDSKIEVVPLLKYSFFKIKIITIAYSFLFPFFFFKKLEQYDYFKSNQMFGAWAPLIASKLTGVFFLARVGYEYFEFYLNRPTSPLKKKLIWAMSKMVYEYSDAIFSTSYKNKSFIHDTFNIPKEKIHIHFNYIDIDLFTPAESKKIEPNILYVGRLDSHKNLPLLIEAIARSKFSLDIVGAGEEEEKLKILAKELSANVNFLGKVPNEKLPSIMHNYTFFALTSKSEGNPKAMLEAMSCGLCPIGVNVPGINEVIEESHGYLCENNLEGLVKTLDLIKNQNHEVLKKQLAARQYIEEHCSLKSQMELELSLI